MQARSLIAELRGGLTGAVLTLGILLPLAQLSFAALGQDALGIAIRAAFVAAVFGNAVAVLGCGIPLANALPRTSTSLVYAGLVASLVDAGLEASDVLVLMTMCVLLSGLLQMAFALLRMGSLVRYVPLPVVGGFVNGIAVLILVAQVAPLSGVSARGADVFMAWRELLPAALLLGLATAAIMWIVTRRWPSWPAAMIALVSGTLVYLVVATLWPGVDMGPLLGTPHSDLPWPMAWRPWLDAGQWRSMTENLPRIAITALVIALIGSLDSLLSAAATENAIKVPFAPNRMLLGLGVANVVSSAFGGLPVVYGTSIVCGMHESGARTRLSGVVNSALLLALLLFGARLLGAIPLTVSAGVMVVIAVRLFDRWSPGLVRQLVTRRGTPEVHASLGIVAIVCIATIAFGFVVAIGVGIGLSFVMFIASMNRSLIRGVATATTRASRRIYAADQTAVVRAAADRVKVVSLEGAVFFGTAETLRREVAALAAESTFVILDMTDVTTIDASGALALERLGGQLEDAGAQLLLAGIVDGDRHARALRAFDHVDAITGDNWFDDVDQALERTEWEALRLAGMVRSELELSLNALPIMEGLTPTQRAALGQSMVRHAFAAGDVLFRRGEPGDHLYALVRGSVTLVEGLGGDGKGGRRIVSFRSGVVFGELALLDGGTRTATAIADIESVGYSLSRDELARLQATAPDVAAQVLRNVAQQISGRLRFATMVMWRRDDGARA